MEVEEDHLKDAQMFTDYALEFRHKGMPDACVYFATEAKERVKKYEHVHEKIHKMLQAYPAANGETREHMCWTILSEKQEQWLHQIKYKLSDM